MIKTNEMLKSNPFYLQGSTKRGVKGMGDVMKGKFYELIGYLDLMIKAMPDRGLKEEDSQKICLLNALNNFEHCVNGLQEEDFIEESEE